jgi:apolipoprotein N-acyltransferase
VAASGGLLASDDGADDVIRAHLEASEELPDGLDLVLWPENVITVKEPVAGPRRPRRSPPSPAGWTPPSSQAWWSARANRFRNASVTWTADGEVSARYEKNQRVPFGEYVPMRDLIEEVTDLSAIPRDAIAGTEPGLWPRPPGDLGVVISYEVFFPRRARDAMAAGAEVLLARRTPRRSPPRRCRRSSWAQPGCGPSRRAGTSSRRRPPACRASSTRMARWSSSRTWGVDSSSWPTSSGGSGDTPYTTLGDGPFVVGALLALAAAWALDGPARGAV